MSTMRAAIIGLGVGEAHARAFQGTVLSGASAVSPGAGEVYSDTGVELYAICDLNPKKLSEVAERLRPTGYATVDPSRILKDPEIQLVSIASFDQDHFPQTMAAIAAGKHVFVEKPLCLALEEAVEIRRALRANPKVQISSNLILRYSDRFAQVRRLIQAGKFGQMYNLEADYNFGRIEKLLSGWRGALPNYSVTLGGGIHVLDLLMWMSGQSIVEVSAFGSHLATSGTQVRFPDTVAALLRFDGGAIGRVTANFPCVYPHFHKLSLYGTDGTFENDISGGRLFLERTEQQYRPSVPQPAVLQPSKMMTEAYKPDGKHQALAAFVSRLSQEGGSSAGFGDDFVGVEDIFRVMAVCFAIDESVRTGKTVSVQNI